MEKDYVIAVATHKELDHFRQIQTDLGWDPFHNSHLTLHQISPQGLFLGKLKGAVISSIIALKYSENFGFVGVYYVKRSHRGKGYGLQIFKRAMKFLADCSYIALDSVDSQVQNYKKWGFQVRCKSYKLFIKSAKENKQKRKFKVLSKMYPELIQKACSFDAVCFPADRRAFLRKCFQFGKGYVCLNQQEQIIGYTICTKCVSGYSMSPLVALTDEAAQDLIVAVQNQFARGELGKSSLITFCLGEHRNVFELMFRWFDRVMYQCQRMVLGTKELDLSRVYAFSNYQRG